MSGDMIVCIIVRLVYPEIPVLANESVFQDGATIVGSLQGLRKAVVARGHPSRPRESLHVPDFSLDCLGQEVFGVHGAVWE